MKRIILTLWLLSLGVLLTGCATVKLGSVPKPAETTRLRVAVLPITGQLSKGKWGKSDENFADDQYKITRRHLDKLGYYELVPEMEVRTVLGDYVPDRWNLLRNDAELARRVGMALYSDYVLLVERGTFGDPFYYFEVTLINMDSGRRFGVKISNTRVRGEKKLPKGTGKLALHELFRDSKEDLLLTALHKIRMKTPPEPAPPGVPQEPKSTSLNNRNVGGLLTATGQVALSRADATKPANADITETSSRLVEYPEVDPDEELQVSGAKRLIVYDLVTGSDTYRQVALILSEALREEIQTRKVYNLVNRENILQIFDEMKLQQSGMVDSSQGVKLGKVAGAQEIVTGNLGMLGNTVVLQSKRTDIQTMLNLSQASLKSEAGKEDQLLNWLARMVDQLLENKRNPKE